MEYDILVIGNGLASNLIVRHFLLKDPNLKIAVVGTAQDRKFKVGESLTEGASHYLMHRLQLSSYMFRRQLYKNGMAFHYTSQSKELDFGHMSMLGVSQPLVYNTFHIDRFVLEEDLIEMNKAEGAHYHLCKVTNIEFAGDYNLVKAQSDSGEITYKGRWILDGTGGARVISKKLGLGKEVENNFHASVWGHFKSANNMDRISKDKLRALRFGPQEFSTNHFVGYGYWIWVIPLKDGTISLGLVYDSKILFEQGPPNQEQFLAYIQEHKGLASLFESMELISFAARSNYSYSTSTFICSKDRFALLADAAAFCDPLYSSGVDGMGRQSDWYTDVILKDLQGLEAKEVELQAQKANKSLAFHYGTYFNMILGNNACLGSAQIQICRFAWDAYSFFLCLLWQYLDGDVEKQDVNKLPLIPSLISNIQNVIATNFNVLAKAYLERGIYHRYNNDCITAREATLTLADRILANKLDDDYQRLRRLFLLEVFNFTWLRQMELYFERKDLLFAQEIIDQFQIVHLPSIQKGQKKSQDFFFKVMKKLLAEMDEATSPLEFWRKWIGRYIKGVKTQFLGHSFADMMKRQCMIPIRLWTPSQHAIKSAHPNPTIQSIAQGYQKAMQNPLGALRGIDLKESHYLFKIEAIAAGLVMNGYDLAHIKLSLNPKDKDNLSKLIAIGCGVGLFYSQNEKFLSASIDQGFLEGIIDGFGFAMGLESYLKTKEVNFPSSSHRYFLVRGLGRSVTYNNVSSNTPEKYKDHFLLYSLWPHDEKAYYEGVGFSLCFSKSLSPEQIFELDFEPHLKAYVKEGVEQAKAAVYNEASVLVG